MVNYDEIYIEPTRQCNIDCVLCYTNRYKAELPEQSIINFINNHNVPTIYWCGGGEVFMYKPFVDIVNRYPNKQHTIMTNGLIDKLDKFARYDNLFFRVSIDGNRDFHDKNRGEGTYDKSVRFCEHLKILNIPFEIRSLSKEVSDELRNLADVSITELYDSGAIKKTTANGISSQLKYVKESDDTFDEPETYISLNCDGIYSCCEGTVRIGNVDETITAEQLSLADGKCKSCVLYGKCT